MPKPQSNEFRYDESKPTRNSDGSHPGTEYSRVVSNGVYAPKVFVPDHDPNANNGKGIDLTKSKD